MKIASKLFYTKDDYALLAVIEGVCNITETSFFDQAITMNISLHPNGIKQLFLPREFRIANAIAQVLSVLKQDDKNERLLALSSLQEECLYAVPLVCRDLRYNTARVLVKVMKELIKSRGNIAKQLHLAHSFQRAARGNLYIVRKLLQEYHLLEMPEEYNQLSFDHHVHDMYSKGTKSPSQVLLDAWIQGVKEISIIYYNNAPQEALEELFEAGKILDITTNFGIEYHIPMYTTFAEIVWSPLPNVQRLSTIRSFFAQPQIQLKMEEGKDYNTTIELFTKEVLKEYNTSKRFILEEEYGIQTKEIALEDYMQYVDKGQSSPYYLAEYIYSTLSKYSSTVHTPHTTLSKDTHNTISTEKKSPHTTHIHTLPPFAMPKHSVHPALYTENALHSLSTIIQKNLDKKTAIATEYQSPPILSSTLSSIHSQEKTPIHSGTQQDTMFSFFTSALTTLQKKSALSTIIPPSSTIHKEEDQIPHVRVEYPKENIYSKPFSLETIRSLIHDIVCTKEDSPFVIKDIYNPSATYSFINTFVTLSPSSYICLNISNITADEVLTIIWAAKGAITHLELFNLQDWLKDGQPEAPLISKIQYAINTRDIQEMKRLVRNMIQELAIKEISHKTERLTTLNAIFNDIPTILQHYEDRHLQVRLGSDSAGGVNRDYNMGFVFEETIPSTISFDKKKRFFRTFPIFAKLRHNYMYSEEYTMTSFWNTKLGKFIHSIPWFQGIGKKRSTSWNVEKDLYEVVSEEYGSIIGTGKTTIGTIEEKRTYPNIITDINNTFLSYAKVFLACVIAFLTFYVSQQTLYLQYFGGIIWLSTTIMRVLFQTMYAVGFGYNCFHYIRNNIIFPRIADLLIATSFAVFIIEYLTRYLLLQKTLSIDVTTHPIIVFTIIAFVSVLLTLFIGRIRGLPKKMVFASISRIFFSIPVALLYTWIFLRLLHYYAVPNADSLVESSATLIARLASESVIGILLGILLRNSFINARLWDYNKTLCNLFADIDTLEQRYPEKEITFLLQQSSIFISIIKKEQNDIFTSLYINLLDFFYFWYYTSNSRKAFDIILKGENPRRKKVLLHLLELLEYPENVDALFTDTKGYTRYNEFIALYKKEYPQFLATMRELLQNDTLTPA